jgi:hypothetical protein
MRKLRLNNRGAIELSIGTIVIVVIAMTMLILGIVLVRKIMCSGIVLTDKVSAETEGQISNLFSTGDFGVKCMGEAGNQVKIGGGGRRQVICVMNFDQSTALELRYDATKTKGYSGIDDTKAKSLVINSNGWSGTANVGKKTVTVAVLDLPRDLPNSAIQLSFDEYRGGAKIDTHTLNIDLVPPGLFSSAIC